jgi:hypothetical protein
MTMDKNATTMGVNEDPLPLNPESPRVESEEDQQDGVRVAEAVTSSWSRRSLIIVYAS